MDYNKIIGSNIRYERKKRDLTIEELSDILCIAPGFLGLIERGQRGTSIKNLCRIADFFSLSLDELITRYVDDDKALSVNEGGDDSDKEKKQLAAGSFINNLDIDELDFVISMLKGLKRYNKVKFNNDFDDAEEFEEV